MKEIIEILNSTPIERVLLYSIVFLFSVGLITRMFIDIVYYITKIFREKEEAEK